MDRATWKALHHAIRADARAFKAEHGGLPCFVRRFQHNGTEWSLVREGWSGRPSSRGFHWTTKIHASRLERQPTASHQHSELNYCAELRQDYRARAWMRDVTRRAYRKTLDILRQYPAPRAA